MLVQQFETSAQRLQWRQKRVKQEVQLKGNGYQEVDQSVSVRLHPLGRHLGQEVLGGIPVDEEVVGVDGQTLDAGVVASNSLDILHGNGKNEVLHLVMLIMTALVSPLAFKYLDSIVKLP